MAVRFWFLITNDVYLYFLFEKSVSRQASLKFLWDAMLCLRIGMIHVSEIRAGASPSIFFEYLLFVRFFWDAWSKFVSPWCAYALHFFQRLMLACAVQVGAQLHTHFVSTFRKPFIFIKKFQWLLFRTCHPTFSLTSDTISPCIQRWRWAWPHSFFSESMTFWSNPEYENHFRYSDALKISYTICH